MLTNLREQFAQEGIVVSSVTIKTAEREKFDLDQEAADRKLQRRKDFLLFLVRDLLGYILAFLLINMYNRLQIYDNSTKLQPNC